MQRLRITFTKGEEVKYLSHLDLMRLWERALRRADVPLAYSHGYNPHPRISIAAPLPIGVTSAGELMDVWLHRRASPYSFTKKVNAQLPSGIDIVGAVQMALSLPSLQSQIRKAEYHVCLMSDKKKSDIEEALSAFLARREFHWQHKREGEVRRYDLRALVDKLWVVECHNSKYIIGMLLRTDNSGTGRAEQLSLALGFADPPESIHRTKLVMVGC
jgi:radical SAM-linked protein